MQNRMLIAFFLVLSACGKSREESERSVTAHDLQTSHLVPPWTDGESRFILAKDFPPATSSERLVEAGRYVLSFEGSPHLSQEDDLKIMAMLHDLEDGGADLLVEFNNPLIAGTTAIAAYDCTRDVLVISPRYRLTAQNLALVLYHELDHKLWCDTLVAGGLTREEADAVMISRGECWAEHRSYAAEVRLFMAMRDRGTPIEMSPDPRFDRWMLTSVVNAWGALAENRFCAWYDQQPKPF